VLLGTSWADEDEDGRLFYIDDRLVAVLVLLSPCHEELSGRWFIDAVFGAPSCDATFGTAEEAAEWLVPHNAARSP